VIDLGHSFEEEVGEEEVNEENDQYARAMRAIKRENR
jgi:hypothetical protein